MKIKTHKMDVSDRLLKVVEYSGLTANAFALKIGVSQPRFRNYLNGRTPDYETLRQICITFVMINERWLITGEGEMLNSTTPKKNANTITEIPLIPISAMAGVLSGNSSLIMEYECEYYSIPMFKGAEFLINVKGDSMIPRYYSGDIVACKRLTLDTFFQWNRVYVIDTEQGVLIKKIQEGKDDDHILLVSENNDYKPFQLHRSSIYSIALVLGVVRAE